MTTLQHNGNGHSRSMAHIALEKILRLDDRSAARSEMVFQAVAGTSYAGT